jgi:hypothetical protein
VVSSRAGGPPQEQGIGRRHDRAVVSGQILVSTVGQVGREQRLGQHGNVGNPIEASQGGVAHRRGVLGGGGGSAEEFTGTRPEQRQVALGVGLVVELGDGMVAPDDDPRQLAMRSAPVTAKSDSTRRWLAVATCGGRRGERRRPEHMAGVRHSRRGRSDVGFGQYYQNDRPLKECDAVAFGRRVASTCPASASAPLTGGPSD